MPRPKKVVEDLTAFRMASMKYLHLQLQHWETYHHHKEQMAFAATGLYLTGTVALALVGKPTLQIPHLRGWVVLLTVLTVLLGFVFVVWQFLHRNTAAFYVRAYGEVLLDLIENPIDKEGMKIDKDDENRPVPARVKVALERARSSYRTFYSPQFSMWITLLVLAAWGLAAIARAVLMARWARF